jgi:hypothetical protein
MGLGRNWGISRVSVGCPTRKDHIPMRKSREVIEARLIRRYFSAVDANEADDWDVLDNYIAEDFVADHPPAPGVTLDRAGIKQSA